LPTYLLGAAAGVSILTGGVVDAVIIVGVLAANTAIGYITESRSEKTIQAFQDLVHPVCEVIREGATQTIPAHEVVGGDILVFKPGTYVAADCRILSASNLSIDESMLTGESLPVFKNPRTLKKRIIALGDRINMAYMGTLVTGGQGTAVVTETAAQTRIGQLKLLLEETTAPKTPIERQLGRLGDQLVLMCGGICGVVFLMGFLRGYGMIEMLQCAISLAAAAVPEGLPAAATINFALGITRMQKHQVLVRRLQAIETLGAVQTICLDKTGTITLNRMTVTEVYTGDRHLQLHKGRFLCMGEETLDPVALPEVQRLIASCVLCNESRINGCDDGGDYRLLGSSTENALIRMALDVGMDVTALRERHRTVEINHRGENRLFMSSVHSGVNGSDFMAVKGSPPEVLARCRHRFVQGHQVLLTDEHRRIIEMKNEDMAGRGLRVLGAAYKEIREHGPVPCEDELVWLGLVGMSDPIRDGVRELIEIFHHAGIETVMITGDQSTTAYSVASCLDLAKDSDHLKILDSTHLTSVAPDALEALARKVHVFARVSPAHKLKIVQALQSAGRTVAMTGDGINDGPALKAADIGVAMGEGGTDVAREVADIVLQKDNLESLTVAIREGRVTYGNIRKSIHFFLSTNISEILIMFTAMALGLGFPLNVMQLLWINIISDIFPGLALSLEPPEPDVMSRPPREADAPLFSKDDYKNMVMESSTMTAGALAAYGYGLARYGIGAAAGSLAFQSLTISQLLHALSCRSEHRSLFEQGEFPPNVYLNRALGWSFFAQLLTVVWPPLRRLLGITVLKATDYGVIGAGALMPLIINETRKKVAHTGNDTTEQ